MNAFSLVILGPSLIGHLASVDVKQHENKVMLGRLFFSCCFCLVFCCCCGFMSGALTMDRA